MSKLPLGVIKLFDFYEIKIKEDRNFSEIYATDAKEAVILNETAVKVLELENPIGKKTNLGTIIGIVKDFNFETLQNSIRPIIFKVYKEEEGNSIIISYDSNKKDKATLIVKTLLGNQNEGLANIFDPTYSDLEMINFMGSMENARKRYFDPDYLETVKDTFYGKEKTFQKTIFY
ncbi:hypothetical protein [Confluentibacter sediminis]|uniref:hypothetical protein n=1 Tax=Confluentibacter sediminis TaxID=2219045 RepID=UPI0013A6925B|nr:hypothetical protein [Confluentibacter sediminis]